MFVQMSIVMRKKILFSLKYFNIILYFHEIFFLFFLNLIFPKYFFIIDIESLKLGPIVEVFSINQSKLLLSEITLCT